MSRIAYVNGRYVPHSEAAVHIEDRGYQFADGVYEVIAVRNGGLVDAGPHLDRLGRSLSELRISPPMTRAALLVVIGEIVRRNRIRDGIVYMQVSRGVAPRDHAFPTRPIKPALVLTAKSVSPAKLNDNAAKGAKVVTAPDIRWQRCDIKTISLLPNCLAKQAARESGAFEAWLVDSDGNITEGSSTNAWIVDQEGNLVTRQISNSILSGITRRSVVALAERHGLKVIERPFTVAEAKSAREAFVTSATSYVTPVVQIDDAVVANGEPGSIATELRRIYSEYMAGEGMQPA